MSIVIFLTWIVLNTSLLNVAMKTGWNFDPGYVGPLILVITINLTLALYASSRRSTDN